MIETDWEAEAARLQAELDTSLQVDLLKRYRKACAEVDVLRGQLASVRAQLDAMRGNR